MDESNPPEDAKKFGLKPNESSMLAGLQNQYFALLGQFLSFVSVERLAYQVTPTTRFRVEQDTHTLFIWEAEPEQPPTPPADTTPDTQPPAGPGNVSTGSDTASALGAK